MLLFITSSSTERKNSLGKVDGISASYLLNRARKVCRTISVSMFVYMAVASTVNNLAPGGIWRSLLSGSKSWIPLCMKG